MKTPIAGHPFPTEFKVGDELLAYDWTSTSWQLAKVAKVHSRRYDPVAALQWVPKPMVQDCDGNWMEDRDYPLQITVHFKGSPTPPPPLPPPDLPSHAHSASRSLCLASLPSFLSLVPLSPSTLL